MLGYAVYYAWHTFLEEMILFYSHLSICIGLAFRVTQMYGLQYC